MPSVPYRDRNEQRRYQRAWIAPRRRSWLAQNGPCRECGSWLALEVDHVDPLLKTSHRLWSLSQARRETELAFCQAVMP